MHNVLTTLIFALMIGITLGGCVKKDELSGGQSPVSAQPGSSATPDASSQPSPVMVTNAPASGFDINKVPVANPQLGKFPYFGLIDGYRHGKFDNKDVDFDRYEFFDGTKIIHVEGRLMTMAAEGQRGIGISGLQDL